MNVISVAALKIEKKSEINVNDANNVTVVTLEKTLPLRDINPPLFNMLNRFLTPNHSSQSKFSKFALCFPDKVKRPQTSSSMVSFAQIKLIAHHRFPKPGMFTVRLIS